MLLCTESSRAVGASSCPNVTHSLRLANISNWRKPPRLKTPNDRAIGLSTPITGEVRHTLRSRFTTQGLEAPTWFILAPCRTSMFCIPYSVPSHGSATHEFRQLSIITSQPQTPLRCRLALSNQDLLAILSLWLLIFVAHQGLPR
jgi:hypothetical protein